MLDADLRGAIVKAVDDVALELAPAGLVGAYLHGSLATGSFYRPKSDVDILFVVEEQLSPERRELVARTLCDRSDVLPLTGDYEISVVRRSSTLRLRHPLPYELHYGEMQKQRIRDGAVDFSRVRTDADLTVHCAAVRARGVVIRGLPIADVVGAVPEGDYRDSILGDLEWILADDNLLESPFYGVLNCCRVLALEALGWDRVLSKDEGGEWALRHLPAEHRLVVAQALACYRSPEPVPPDERRTDGHAWDAGALREFRSYVEAERVPGPFEAT